MVIKKIRDANFFIYGMGIFTMICIVLSLVFDNILLALLPLMFIIGVLFVIDFKPFYFFLFASVPLCIEWDIPGGFSTDIPIEPLCICLMFATIIYLILNFKEINFSFLQSPLIFIVAISLLWTVICVFPSKNPLISAKYVLSKIWYLTTYLFLTIMIVQTRRDLRRLFWAIFIPLFFTSVYAFIRHYLNGFSFELMNEPSLPFYRNHVMYAATITVFYPFILLAKTWYARHSLIRYFLVFNQFFFLVAIYFSYTRACLLALLVGAAFYYILKRKWVKPALAAALIGILSITFYFAYQNNYLKYAPEFTKTIYHDSYDNHIEATFEGHDASSMERINMWIGAIRMFPHYPIFGVGPGNFFPNYKSYTVIHYHTWVSDNELKLSCHNYFLLLLTEQGLPSLIFFIILTCLIFLIIEIQYHQSGNEETKNILLCLGAAFSMLYVNLALSDLIETAKIGSLFFMMIALLVNIKMQKLNS
jgi:O-antigen ligase